MLSLVDLPDETLDGEIGPRLTLSSAVAVSLLSKRLNNIFSRPNSALKRKLANLDPDDHPVEPLLIDTLNLSEPSTELFLEFLTAFRKSIRSLEYLSYEKISRRIWELNVPGLFDKFEALTGRYEQTPTVLLRGASATGDIDNVRAIAKKARIPLDRTSAEVVAKAAAHKGHIALLEWALTLLSDSEAAAFISDSTFAWAATAGGHTKVWEWAIAKNFGKLTDAQMKAWVSASQIWAVDCASPIPMLDYLFGVCGEVHVELIGNCANTKGIVEILNWAFTKAKAPPIPQLVSALPDAIANGYFPFVEFCLEKLKGVTLKFSSLLNISIGSMDQRLVELLMAKAKVTDLSGLPSAGFFSRYQGTKAHHAFWDFLTSKGLKLDLETLKPRYGEELLRVLAPNAVEFTLTSEVFDFYSKKLGIPMTEARLEPVLHLVNHSGVKWLIERSFPKDLYLKLFNFIPNTGELRSLKLLLKSSFFSNRAETLRLVSAQLPTVLSQVHVLDFYLLTYPELFTPTLLNTLLDTFCKKNKLTYSTRNTFEWLASKGAVLQSTLVVFALKKPADLWFYDFLASHNCALPGELDDHLKKTRYSPEDKALIRKILGKEKE